MGLNSFSPLVTPIMSKLTNALDGILKISSNPNSFYKGAKKGGDWSHEEMFRVICKNAQTILDDLKEKGVIQTKEG